jgi:hypothetical protein
MTSADAFAVAPRVRRPVVWQALALLVVLAFSFTAYELRFPYYFLQDDNRDNLLPYTVVAGRALAVGELAQIDFHQSLGLPLLANGQSAVLSPLPYLALALSHGLFGHPYATMDLLALLSFALGAAGSLVLARRLGLGPIAAVLGAASWICNPFLVYLQVSWQIAPLVAFLPWIVAAALALRERPTAGRFAVFVLAHLGLLFGGNVQWFVDAVLFELLLLGGVELVGRRRGARTRHQAVLAAALGAALVLGLPLLLPVWHQSSVSVERGRALPWDEFAANAFTPGTWLNGVLFPFARVASRAANNGFVDYASPAGLAHLGYVPLALAAVFLVRRARGRTLAAPETAAAFWPVAAALALIALLWAFGALSPALHHVPLLDRFRWPFKMLAFVNFFLGWLAAGALDACTRESVRARFVGGLAVVLQVVNLVGVSVGHSFRGNYRHADPVPLVEPRAAELSDGRLFTIATPLGLGDPSRTAPLLGFDYASLFGLDAFGGYDPLMPAANAAATFGLNYQAEWTRSPGEIPFDVLRQWGVRWYLVPPVMEREFVAAFARAGLVRRAEDPARVLYRDPAARPLASWEDDSSATGLFLARRGNSLLIDAESGAARRVVVAFLGSPFYEATLDGRPAVSESDGLGRIVVALPAGRHRLELRYDDPFFRLGVRAALSGCAAALALAFVFRRRFSFPPQSRGRT